MILMEHSTVDNVPKILLVAFGEEHHCFSVALGCLMETFAVRILACNRQLPTSSLGTDRGYRIKVNPNPCIPV